VKAVELNPPGTTAATMSMLWNGGVSVGATGTERFDIEVEGEQSIVVLRHRWRSTQYLHMSRERTASARQRIENEKWAQKVVEGAVLTLSVSQSRTLKRAREDIGNNADVGSSLDRLEEARYATHTNSKTAPRASERIVHMY
jgi:hypothetical protein